MSKMFLWNVEITCHNGDGRSSNEGAITPRSSHKIQLTITKSTNPASLIKGLNINQLEPLHHFKGSRIFIDCEVTAVIDEGDLMTALDASLPEDEIPLAEERVHADELAAQESPDVPDGGESRTIDQYPPLHEPRAQPERPTGCDGLRDDSIRTTPR